MIYQFRFWKEWCDEQGRMWAEPYSFDSSVDARRSHEAALGWQWVQDKVRPSVSALYSVAFAEDPATGKKREQNRTIIAESGRREYHEATLSGVRPTVRRVEVPIAHGPARAGQKQDGNDTPF
jgi:hypothetical protein